MPLSPNSVALELLSEPAPASGAATIPSPAGDGEKAPAPTLDSDMTIYQSAMAAAMVGDASEVRRLIDVQTDFDLLYWFVNYATGPTMGCTLLHAACKVVLLSAPAQRLLVIDDPPSPHALTPSPRSAPRAALGSSCRC